ncbi:MAG: peroxide stress protein YaaA [Alphaproteobacteria bacterium CG_4_9_14_3_um_filter_47_13]|nr:MAG: peroxide stress protein YaaA [Alphaproteobacteria bacterium CG_4_9_14_3_um_filter_47_13]
MLALISPAKKLDFESVWDKRDYTQPAFPDHTQELAADLKKISQGELQKLMNLSEALAALNVRRYQDFTTPLTPENARPAITAFCGDTYLGLEAASFSREDKAYAQDHLRILSGFYGLLRPLDLMQAYRLEMGTKLTNKRGKDLYAFWGELLTQACNEAVKNHKDKSVISLASLEYIKAIQPQRLAHSFITCHFKEMKGDAPKVIGLFAKRARGMMARYIIQNRIETPEGLKDFDKEGYKFMPILSDQSDFVFVRS